MGIYTNYDIFGIKIYTIQPDDNLNTLLEIKYNDIMSDEEKNRAYLFYQRLDNKDNILLQIYTECSTTYEEGGFMMWYAISSSVFIEKINIAK